MLGLFNEGLLSFTVFNRNTSLRIDLAETLARLNQKVTVLGNGVDERSALFETLGDGILNHCL